MLTYERHQHEIVINFHPAHEFYSRPKPQAHNAARDTHKCRSQNDEWRSAVRHLPKPVRPKDRITCLEHGSLTTERRTSSDGLSPCLCCSPMCRRYLSLQIVAYDCHGETWFLAQHGARARGIPTLWLKGMEVVHRLQYLS